MEKLYIHNGITIGADPEFFFKKNGKIIGSEKVIPKRGLSVNKESSPYNGSRIIYGKLVRDGVQAEINIKPQTCRQILGDNFGKIFRYIKKLAKDKGVKVCFDQLVKVSKEELMSLSPQSRMFGCARSYNVYEPDGTSIPIEENAEEYLYRCAGGHIHLGADKRSCIFSALKDYEKLIPTMDILVGNTCVLLDRARGNKERRRTYGRAGEYRKPAYGVEYRVLSNFWLRDYKLMSFVTGLSRLAVQIVANTTKENDYVGELRKLVKQEDIIKAINTNDKKLAKKNFDKIKGFITEITDTSYGLPFDKNRIKKFEVFIKKPIKSWFKGSPLVRWTSSYDYLQLAGWENFLSRNVRSG